ncbi:MAG: NADH-quinone oxidoreductase subunit A [Oceanicoccus sp.]|jgi:NADH-quinone oxidoreductase subunit A
MVNEYSQEIWPLAVYFCMVIALVITMLVLSWLLGQRRREDATNDPYESGVVHVGSSQIRISVEFYLIAIFFVIFDLETVFIFAWAIAFFELGWQGYFAILLFIFVLGVALIYEWRSGALEWGVKTRKGLRQAQMQQATLSSVIQGEQK